MKKILIANELGGGLGHAAIAQQIALALQALASSAGTACEVHIASTRAADLAHLQFEPSAPIKLHHVPQRWLPQLALEASATYAELLLGAGYASAPLLQHNYLAWQQLMQQVKPDVLYADFAPTAQLAAHQQGCRIIAGGHGFVVPPPSGAMPIFRDWEAVDAHRVAAAEQQVIHNISTAIKAYASYRNSHYGRHSRNGVGKASLASLLRRDAAVVASWPELDPYAALRPAQYSGPLYMSGMNGAHNHSTSESPPSQHNQRTRVFAYLRYDAQHKQHAHLIAALSALPVICTIYLQGAQAAADDEISAMSSPHIRITPQPVDMQHMLADCDLVICHAGHGMIASAIHHGLPLLCLPLHAEQFINARLIHRLGIGLYVYGQAAQQDYVRVLQLLLDALPQCTQHAQQLQARHDWSSRHAAERIAQLILRDF